MSIYLQYHNVSKRGLKYLFSNDGWYGITTKRGHVRNANGSVLVIVGLGQPRQFYLWEHFRIDEVDENPNGSFSAWGPGWQLSPPQKLEGPAFENFKSSCASFVGFRRIDDLPYTKTLLKIAKANRKPSSVAKRRRFFEEIASVLKSGSADYKIAVRALKKLGGDPSAAKARTRDVLRKKLRALSIRQPYAEAIMRGRKPIEYRRKNTHIRGRVQIYASLGRFPVEENEVDMKRFGITDIDCGDLPRGVLIGTVEISDCKWNGDEYEWHLTNPIRAKKLLKPKNQPQPVWFNPF
jgi:hypothetical protein